mgnify:CR=1 FL=1
MGGGGGVGGGTDGVVAAREDDSIVVCGDGKYWVAWCARHLVDGWVFGWVAGF